jgi:hypothetical protein
VWGDAVKQMDAQNEWNGTRKVMKEIESRRVSSSPAANVRACGGDASANATSDAGVTLWKHLRPAMKRMLKAVVEVQYTTGKLEVAG